jgi:MYXO-CTERM domain-containing protein
MKASFAFGAIVAASGLSVGASADLVGVVGGQTNVLLDFELISSVTDLELTGVSDGVIIPGNLGSDSVAFAITSPYAEAGATTFQYDTMDFFGSFSGTIGHRGTLTFNDAVTIGNFEIGFDPILGVFTVSDTYSSLGALFEVGITDASPLVGTFDVMGDLLITENFAMILLDLGLASSDLTGADVGDAWVQGLNQAVPTPGALALGCVAMLGSRRRRRS